MANKIKICIQCNACACLLCPYYLQHCILIFFVWLTLQQQRVIKGLVSLINMYISLDTRVWLNKCCSSKIQSSTDPDISNKTDLQRAREHGGGRKRIISNHSCVVNSCSHLMMLRKLPWLCRSAWEQLVCEMQASFLAEPPWICTYSRPLAVLSLCLLK